MGRGKRRPPAKVLKRREQVKRYFIRGLSYREMAELLGVSHETIRKDVDAIFDEIYQALSSQEGQNLIAETALQFKEIERQAWRIYHSTDREHIKLQALQRAESARERLIKILQSLEVLRQAPQRVELSVQDRIVEELLRGIHNDGNTDASDN